LDLFFYIWALNIQWLILKKVVRFVQKLYEICARNITKKEKKKKKRETDKKKMHVASLQLTPALLSSNTMADF
jgi:hypothetical protein